MVEVQVGQDDVPYVGVIEAERLDLADRRVALVEARVHQVPHRAHPLGGAPQVLEAEAGVHQDQPGAIGLDE